MVCIKVLDEVSLLARSLRKRSIMSHIRSRIKELRILNKVTQERMGMVLGIGREAYGDIERGVTKLDVERLEVILDKLDHEFLIIPKRK